MQSKISLKKSKQRELNLNEHKRPILKGQFFWPIPLINSTDRGIFSPRSIEEEEIFDLIREPGQHRDFFANPDLIFVRGDFKSDFLLSHFLSHFCHNFVPAWMNGSYAVLPRRDVRL